MWPKPRQSETSCHPTDSTSRGGDLIRLAGEAGDWRAAQQGSSALLTDGDTHIIVPAGTGGIALAFEDGVRTLLLDTGTQSLMIGSQSLNETLTTVTAPANGADLPDEGDLGVSARLLLSPGGTATAGGNFDIFGSAGAEKLTLLAGDFQLDPSFNRGGDEVAFGAAAPSFTAVREGSAVVLTQGESEIYIPVGLAGLDLNFAGETRTLLYNQELQAVFIGSQTIGFDIGALSEFV